MNNKPQYAYLLNKDIWPTSVILHLATGTIGYPKIIRFEDKEEIEKALEDIAQHRIVSAKVPGYSIFINYSGSLAYHPSLAKEELLDIVKGMADFFASYTIAQKPGRFIKSIDNYYKGCPGDWKPLTPEQFAAKKSKKNRPE